MRAGSVILALGIMLLGMVGGCWGQAGARGLPPELTAELLGPDLPAGEYTLVRSWSAESGAMHQTGHAVEDPDALDGQAWEGTPGEDGPGTLLFGPYIEIEPGDYVAFFRVKLLGSQEEDTLGQLDACVDYGQQMLTARELYGSDLASGRYVQAPLGLRYQRGKLECRFLWNGFAAVRFDQVSLYRLEGGNIAALGRVPEAVPSGLPTDLPYYSEPRPFPDIFPQSQPLAPRLLVCDLSKEPLDRRLMVLALQGLINREQPQAYCLYTGLDAFWLQRMVERGWIEGTEPITPDGLLQRFRDRINGMIITDPRLPATKNVATMLAAVEDGLVVSPRIARGLDLPVLEDLRGRWETSADAYRWAFDNLWPRLNHHVIACSWPDHLGLRDYLVQHKVFIFWLSGPLDGARKGASPDAEVRLMEELLAKMPVNIPVMSYPWAGKDVGIGEGPGVSLFAEFGKYLVGSIDCTNLSVHSGLRLPAPRQQPAPPPPALQADKVYVSFILSDGDNLPVLTNGNFPQLWESPARGRIPIGWTLSPSANLLVPDIVDYYYTTATPQDYFLCAVSGVGYTYPDVYAKRYREPDRQRVFDEFLEQTATYMERSDLRSAWIMGATRSEVISRFAERISFLEALFPDYGRRITDAGEATYPTARNVPVFHAAAGWRMEATREQRISDLVADARRMTPASRPAFLHLFVLNWFADLPMLEEALQQLGPEYVAVRPDHLAALYRQYLAREGVLLQTPSAVAAIEGQPLALKVRLRNVSETQLDLLVDVPAGLDKADVHPGQLTLAPAEEQAVRIFGTPTGETLEVRARAELVTRLARLAVRRIGPEEVAGELPPTAALLPVRVLEAEELPHLSGAAEADPAASAGAWMARPGEAQPGHIVFGPYAPLAAGRYLALFRLKRLGEGDGPLALLDTCVGGGSPQTGQRQLLAQELPTNEWRWVPLVFDHPGGAFETRVEWPGRIPLAVDSIAVWEIESPG